MYESLISGVGPDGQLWRGPAAMAVLASFNFDVDNRGSKVQKPLMKMYEGLELAYKGLESRKLKTLKEAGFNSSGWMPAFFEPYYSKDPKIKAIERGNAGFASRGNRNAAQFRDALFDKFGVSSFDEKIGADKITARSEEEVLADEERSLQSSLTGLRNLIEPIEARLAEIRSLRSSKAIEARLAEIRSLRSSKAA